MTIRILAAVVGLIGLTGCGTPYMRYANPLAEVYEAPPEGKALVNFHRPSREGSGRVHSVFDGTILAGVTKGGQRFQYVCEPGLHIFIGRNKRGGPISVVRGDLEAGRIYDCLIEVSHSFFGGWEPRALVPMTRSENRRPLVPRWEAMERVLVLDLTKDIVSWETQWAGENQRAVVDFDGGPKHHRLLYLTAPDARD